MAGSRKLEPARQEVNVGEVSILAKSLSKIQ